jgi:hypothetical protein
MHNPKIWEGHQPISHRPCTFVTKYEDILDQEEVLITLMNGSKTKLTIHFAYA